MRAATTDELLATTRPLAPRMAGRLVEAVKAALDAQTVVVPGTTAAATVLPHLARSLRSVHHQRDQVAVQVEEILDAHPLARVLTSMTGIGIRTSARIPLEIGDIAAFVTAGRLAAYAGLAPVTRRSGSSIKGEHSPRAATRPSNARCSWPRSPSSPTRTAGPTTTAREPRAKHSAALICLARRRPDVIYGMLRDKQPYQPDRTPSAQAA